MKLSNTALECVISNYTNHHNMDDVSNGAVVIFGWLVFIELSSR